VAVRNEKTDGRGEMVILTFGVCSRVRDGGVHGTMAAADDNARRQRLRLVDGTGRTGRVGVRARARNSISTASVRPSVVVFVKRYARTHSARTSAPSAHSPTRPRRSGPSTPSARTLFRPSISTVECRVPRLVIFDAAAGVGCRGRTRP